MLFYLYSSHVAQRNINNNIEYDFISSRRSRGKIKTKRRARPKDANREKETSAFDFPIFFSAQNRSNKRTAEQWQPSVNKYKSRKIYIFFSSAIRVHVYIALWCLIFFGAPLLSASSTLQRNETFLFIVFKTRVEISSFISYMARSRFLSNILF